MMLRLRWLPLPATVLVISLAARSSRAADPPVPSGAHPRLFMTAANVAKFTTLATTSGTTSASLVSQCQATINKPSDYKARNGVDSDTWPQAAVACAFAYLATGQSKYLTQAILYWKTSLNDDATMGDGLGCTAANDNPNWMAWDGSGNAPPGILTIVHDTGYPIRWYGPFLALTYDWLYNAAGVDDSLRAQTRSCLTAWVDYYTAKGYLNDQSGMNYNAGFVVAKTMSAIAIGNDGGADGHLWTETLHNVFSTLLVGQGLAGSAGALGTPAGIMVGGDWGSWQYGPLSVAEYAAAARAVEENGAPQPEMDAWVNSLILRQIYGTLPKKDVQFSGNGDYDSDGPYGPLSPTQVDAVLLGPSTDQAAAWALPTKQGLDTSQAGFFWNALAELRTVTGQDYTTASPAPALWYLARGTGNLYARTSWDASAYWSVFMAPSAETDHGHLAVSNFVFSHGGDHLIVDSSNYGEPATFETNAISADTGVVDGDYPKTQFNYPANALPWARGTNDGVFAARADVTDAFNFRGKADIPYAHREWTFLPEGEIVTIDRVHTAATSRNMYINFHANTGGTLKLDGTTWVATGTVGGSTLTIHPVLLSGGMPQIVKVPAGGCTLSCNYPCGSCNAARFAVDEYSLTVPGTWAVAIHVIDGLGGGDAAAQVGSLNDDNFDPAPKQNAGVIGAAVFRGSKQSYVVASSAQDGAAGASFSYGVPGASPGRHIVYDAPEASDGTSSVTAAAAGGRCVLTIAAGSGGGIAGHPLMFGVAPAGDGCTVAAGTDVAPGTPPPGGGVTPNPPGTGGVGGPGSVSGGCCAIASGTRRGAWTGLAMALACMFLARQQRRPRREAGSRSPLRDPE